MVRTPATVALFQKAAVIAAELGFPVDETGTGGGSDGNFTSALGVPTLDGLGVAGNGGHAQHEHVIISSLPERAALLASMLRTPSLVRHDIWCMQRSYNPCSLANRSASSRAERSTIGIPMPG